MTTALQQLRLTDGRTVACTSAAEARMIWGEMTQDGYYRRAAARLRPGDIVLDIGANIGLVSMMFAEVCPGARIIAAEPAPAIFPCLRKNLAAHVPESVAVDRAVGAEKGMLPFTWYPRASVNSSLYADPVDDDAATRTFLRNSGLPDEAIAVIAEGMHEGEQIEVAVTTVSDLLENYGSGAPVGVLKIDVERAEWDVLRGIADTDWQRIRSVVAEVHDRAGRLAQICTLLTAHGLQPRTRQDPSLSGTELYEVYACRE